MSEFGVTCPALASSSVELTCSLQGTPVPCNKPAQVKTIANLKCKSSYKSVSVTSYSDIICGSTGQWNYPVFDCVPGNYIYSLKNGKFIIGWNLYTPQLL